MTDDRSAAVERLLTERVAQVIERDELRRLLLGDRPLRVKFGVDPTSADLHIGHAVPFERLRAFQELGHLPVLVIGDTTAQLGDPSDRDRTRPMLSAEQVRANAATYLDQYRKVVDPARTEVRWQSEWFGRFGLADVVRLTSRFTLARMVERDTFAKRLADGAPISMHETLYPLLQAYDSVAVAADVELGGTDQTFNLLVGRDIQREFGQAPQQVMTTELIVGIDGAQKMSKSYGNAIGLADPPYEQYARVMSIPDALMGDWFRLATPLPETERETILAGVASGAIHAKAAKQRLAREIVARWHSPAAADAAEEEWERTVAGGAGVRADELVVIDAPLAWPQLLVRAGLAASNSEARRLIAQSGVRRNGEVLSDASPALRSGEEAEVRVGKRRAARVRVA